MLAIMGGRLFLMIRLDGLTGKPTEVLLRIFQIVK